MFVSSAGAVATCHPRSLELAVLNVLRGNELMFCACALCLPTVPAHACLPGESGHDLCVGVQC